MPGFLSDTNPDGYAWGCLIDRYHFLYLYGSMTDYWHLRRGLGREQHLLDKGGGATLQEVRRHAERAAQDLGGLYDELGGSVRVMSVLDYGRPTAPASFANRTAPRPTRASA